jgi:hypothetical protein
MHPAYLYVILAAWPELYRCYISETCFKSSGDCFPPVSKDVNKWRIISFLVLGRCVSKRYLGENKKVHNNNFSGIECKVSKIQCNI